MVVLQEVVVAAVSCIVASVSLINRTMKLASATDTPTDHPALRLSIEISPLRKVSWTYSRKVDHT